MTLFHDAIFVSTINLLPIYCCCKTVTKCMIFFCSMDIAHEFRRTVIRSKLTKLSSHHVGLSGIKTKVKQTHSLIKLLSVFPQSIAVFFCDDGKQATKHSPYLNQNLRLTNNLNVIECGIIERAHFILISTTVGVGAVQNKSNFLFIVSFL